MTYLLQGGGGGSRGFSSAKTCTTSSRLPRAHASTNFFIKSNARSLLEMTIPRNIARTRNKTFKIHCLLESIYVLSSGIIIVTFQNEKKK